jgi:hypothetical protein
MSFILTTYSQQIEAFSGLYNHYLFYDACQTWMISKEQRKTTRLQFGQLLAKVWERAAITGNSVSGF